MAQPLWLLGPRRLGVVLAGALLLCWPMLLLDGPLLFPDTRAYIRGGELTVHALLRAASGIWGAGDGDGTTATLGAVTAQTESLRSVPWSVFSYVFWRPFGAFGVAVAQNAIVLMFVVALFRGETVRPGEAFVAALAVALLTPLPWYGSFVMPDLIAAAVMLYGVLLAGPIDRLGWVDRIVLALLAAFAMLSHHGYLPLGIAVILAALAVRLFRGRGIGRDIALVAAAAPPALAVMTMLVGSTAVLDGPSIAPRRLPILLARSIADGPARWHLEEHCATEGYAVCDMFETIPTSVDRVLWGEQGLRYTASTEQMQRIRDEEPIILWRALKEYPLLQSWSLVRNAAHQLVLLGGKDLASGEIVRNAAGDLEIHLTVETGRVTIEAFTVVWKISALAALTWIAAMAVRGRLSPSEQDMVVMLAVGFLANAAIFGGLSAPAERYQARVVWLVPALAVTFWLSRHTASPAHAASRAASHGF